MTTVLGILGFAALYGAFALLGPMLTRKQCHGGGCASCPSGSECKLEREP